MYLVLVGPDMEVSKEVYVRFEELYDKQIDGTLVDESPEQAELSVLCTLLSVNPGDEVRFETSFSHLCHYATETSGTMKGHYNRTLEAWIKVGEMIGIR